MGMAGVALSSEDDEAFVAEMMGCASAPSADAPLPFEVLRREPSGAVVDAATGEPYRGSGVDQEICDGTYPAPTHDARLKAMWDATVELSKC